MYFAKGNKKHRFASDPLMSTLEMLGGFACLIFFAPLILAVFLLLKAEGGPAFVGRQYIGSDGTPSTLWRFRTRSPGKADTLSAFLLWSRAEVLPEIYNVAKGDIRFARMLADI